MTLSNLQTMINVHNHTRQMIDHPSGRIHINAAIELTNVITVPIYIKFPPVNSRRAKLALLNWSIVWPEWLSLCQESGSDVVAWNMCSWNDLLIWNLSFSSRTRALPWKIRCTRGISQRMISIIIVFFIKSGHHNWRVLISLPTKYGPSVVTISEMMKKENMIIIIYFLFAYFRYCLKR